jgi:hypothetical protein
MEMLVIGPVGHVTGAQAKLTDDGEAILTHKGYRLVARAKPGPVGWVGELCIVLSPADSPLHGFFPVGRFHMDRETALREALIEGILRVERGDVFQL